MSERCHCGHLNESCDLPERMDPDERAAERRFANQKLTPDPVSALAKTPPPDSRASRMEDH